MLRRQGRKFGSSQRVCTDYIGKGKELVEVFKQGPAITFAFIKIIRMNKENKLVERIGSGVSNLC